MMADPRIVLVVLVLSPSAWGLINPRFTPVDLIRGSTQVLLLEIAGPEKQAVSATVAATLRGTAPANPKMTLQLAEAGGNLETDLTVSMAGKPTTSGLLVMENPQNVDLTKDPLGAVLIGKNWFAVFQRDGKLVLDADPKELGAVWAGGAANLAAAVPYLQKDPTAKFPVRSDLTWAEVERFNPSMIQSLNDSIPQ